AVEFDNKKKHHLIHGVSTYFHGVSHTPNLHFPNHSLRRSFFRRISTTHRNPLIPVFINRVSETVTIGSLCFSSPMAPKDLFLDEEEQDLSFREDMTVHYRFECQDNLDKGFETNTPFSWITSSFKEDA
ncbi:hypothetical protein HID58_022632, partial [Brassica napus]